jgi:uncharacterized phage protein gp47/JayE
VSYAAEPYAQFVDDLLTGMTGGTTRQRFVFLPDAAPFRLASAYPVIPATVRVFGQAAGAFQRFRPRDDWNLAEGTVIVWNPAAGAVRPDEGSDFFVNFEVHAPAGLQLPLTDRNPGSVTRLLAESFGREMAVLSRQMEAVYLAGFVETAGGRDLDALVRLAGVERRGGTAAVGSAIFSRSTPAPGDVFVPAGTRLSTGDVPAVDFETTEDGTLRRGELSVEVVIAASAVRARSAGGAEGVVPAGRVSVIHRPILGIERVENPHPTRIGSAAEGDEALRARARRALEVAGGATTGALRGGIGSLSGLREKDVRLSEDHLTHPGRIEIQVALPDAPVAEREEIGRRAAAAIEELRPAGVRVAHNLPLAAPPGVVAAGPGERPEDDAPVETPAGSALPVAVKVRLTPASAVLAGEERNGLDRAAKAAMRAFFSDLGIGEALIYNRAIAALMALPGVLDADLQWRAAGSGEAPGPFHRRNLFPADPGVRATSASEEPTVEIGGQLVVLHVNARVTLRGAGLVGDAAANRAEALRQIEERLRNGLSSVGAVLDRPALEGLLASAESFTAELHYTVDYVEAGVRIRKRDLALPLTGLETIWIASVAEEGGT